MKVIFKITLQLIKEIIIIALNLIFLYFAYNLCDFMSEKKVLNTKIKKFQSILTLIFCAKIYIFLSFILYEFLSKPYVI